jgi:pimeloyl-ACP methyl ester carboxylesterase
MRPCGQPFGDGCASNTLLGGDAASTASAGHSRFGPRMKVNAKVRRIGRNLAIALGVYLGLCVVAGIGLAEISLHLPKHRYEDRAGFQARVLRQFQAHVYDVQTTGEDGAVLRAWFVEPPHPNGQSVILLHGIAGNRIDPSGYGDIFLRHGYSILLPDSREHGVSGGKIATYGILERNDVKRWVAMVRHRDPGCTYLLGESMGAAIGLQATEVTPELCAVAVEAPYAHFREISYERLGHATDTGPLFWRTVGRPVSEAAILFARVRYGIWLPDAAPASAVERSHTPTLLIAGTKDEQIPMHNSVELEQACQDHCMLWIVPGADHGGASTVEPIAFQHRVLAFFRKHE